MPTVFEGAERLADLNFVTGTAGNDVITLATVSAGVEGAPIQGLNVVGAGLGDDVVETGDQHDRIGGDTKRGIPDGDDFIPEGESYGSDTLSGAGGPDLIIGDVDLPSPGTFGGNDEVHGGPGDDILYGDGNPGMTDATGGADRIFGDGETDVIFGEAASMNGGRGGADQIDGGAGDDTIFGEAGRLEGAVIAAADIINGGDGNDVIFGDGIGTAGDYTGGADKIEGGAGDDFVSGDAGNDLLTGGLGADIFAFDVGSGKDNLMDFKAKEGDTVDLTGYFAAGGLDLSDILGANGVLNKGDEGVKVKKGTMTIDLGVMFDTSAAHVDTLVLKGVTSIDGNAIVAG